MIGLVIGVALFVFGAVFLVVLAWLANVTVGAIITMCLGWLVVVGAMAFREHDD